MKVSDGVLISIIISVLTIVSAPAQNSAPENVTEQAASRNDQGVELLEKGNLKESAEMFRAAIRLRPDYAVAYGNLGAVLCRAGQLKESSAAFEKAIEQKSNFAEDYNNLGAIFVQIGRRSESVI